MANPADGHRQRLRARLADDPARLADYEVLELLLCAVIPRRDTKPLAKELLRRFGSIKGVLEARPGELEDIHGFGQGLHSLWLLLREIMARHAESPARNREIAASPEVVAEIARRRLAGMPHEEIWLAFVDTQNRLLAWERGSKGSLETAPLHPRDVMERALRLKAAGLIVVHNHPGGNPKPSGADIDLTRRLKAAADALGIRLLDHVVVTDDGSCSMMRDGLLP